MELSRIWQNIAEYSRIWQNMAEYGRIWQIAVRLPHIAVRLLSYSWFLVKLIKIGRRV